MGEVGQASAGPGCAEGEPDSVGGAAVIAWSGGGDQVAAWGNRAVQLGFSFGGGDPHQEVGGPLGGGMSEVVVAGERGDEMADGFLAVAFEEEAEHRVDSRQWPNPWGWMSRPQVAWQRCWDHQRASSVLGWWRA